MYLWFECQVENKNILPKKNLFIFIIYILKKKNKYRKPRGIVPII